ncbi:MAG: sulfotransferase [Desulfobacterales bacterium]|nr:sulfotransferase [Desulfobacterales bacterium]
MPKKFRTLEVNNNFMPNLLIAGAGKSGTTSLHYYLRQHPEIFMCTPKEPHFFRAQFSRFPMNGPGDNIKKVYKNFEDYKKLFKKVDGQKVIGDASASNLYYAEKVIPYIEKYLGDPKIIISLRNPVERAYSAYLNLILQNREWLSFQEALAQEDKRIKDNWRHSWFYKNTGFYYKRVKAYIENFSDVKVYLFDDLKKDPLSLVQDIYDLLGVEPTFVPDVNARFASSGIPRFKAVSLLWRETKFRNAISWIGKGVLSEQIWYKLRDMLRKKFVTKPDMAAATRRYLLNEYRDDILQLQTLIGRDLSHWLNDNVDK